MLLSTYITELKNVLDDTGDCIVVFNPNDIRLDINEYYERNRKPRVVNISRNKFDGELKVVTDEYRNANKAEKIETAVLL